MELRWIELKKIHHLISTGCHDNRLYPQNPKKLSATLKVLLSLEMKSCDLYPSRCLHCHQLLALGVVKMLYDDSSLDAVKNICKEFDESFEDTVVSCMFVNSDQFVVYSASKALLAMLNSDLLSEKRTFCVLEKIFVGIEDRKKHQIQTVLEILTLCISRKTSPDLKQISFNIVKLNFTKISQIWKNDSQKDLDFYVYSLLQKLVKYIHKQSNQDELLQNILGDSILEFIPVLFTDSTISWKTDSTNSSKTDSTNACKTDSSKSCNTESSITCMTDSSNTCKTDSENNCKVDSTKSSNTDSTTSCNNHLLKTFNTESPSTCKTDSTKSYKNDSTNSFQTNSTNSCNTASSERTLSDPKNQNVRVSLRKLLDFFNQFLNFSDYLVLQKSVADIYLEVCRHFSNCISEKGFSVIMDTNHVGFTGQRLPTSQFDLPLIRRLTLLTFSIFAVLIKHDYVTDLDSILERLEWFMKRLSLTVHVDDAMNLQWLPLVFEDQDDSYIECLLCLLDMYAWLHKRKPTSALLQMLEPCHLFLQFLDTMNFDPSVVMDWLESPETCFLLYFSRFLKSIINDWLRFTQAAHALYGSDCTWNKPPGDASNDIVPNMECDSIVTSKAECVNNCEMQDQSSMQNKNSSADNEEIVVKADIDIEIDNVMKLTSGLSAIMTYSDDSGSDSDNNHEDCCHGNDQISDHSYNLISCPKDEDISDGKILKDDSILDSDWSMRSCDMLCCDQVMSMLIRVRIQIERLVDQDLFPYNPAPLLSLLTQCEDLYES